MSTTSPQIDLQGRCYLITGAGGGIGRAMVLGLLEAGASVVAGDVSASGLAALEDIAHNNSNRLKAIELDVCSEADANNAVAIALSRFNRLDGVINNAGIGQEQITSNYFSDPPPFWTVAPELWRQIMAVNATGPFLLARAATPAMLAAGWGRIINITTSLTTMLRRGMAPYAGSKAATEAHTVTMAKDLAGTGVTANVLVPGGPVNTTMVPDMENVSREALLQPEVMVAPLLWLLSPQSDSVNGRRFVAALWDKSIDPLAAAEVAGAPAAWPLPEGDGVILPKGSTVAT